MVARGRLCGLALRGLGDAHFAFRITSCFGDSNCAEYNQTAGNDVAITYRDSVREFYPHSGMVGVGRRIAFEQPQIPKTPLTGATRWKPKTADKLNLLMIISDQHRWDCLGEAGNTIIHTPNLDQLARDGAHFTKAYTVCPICAPSRTSMLAGQSPEQTKVRGNGDLTTAPRRMTYDRVLLESGWSGEYKGKYHSPYQYTRDEHDKTYYSQPVQWMNGKGPSNPPKGIQSLTDTYRSYLDLHEPLQQLLPGQLLDSCYRRPYWADVADLRYEQAFNKSLLALSNHLIRQGHADKVPKSPQQNVNGRLALSANHSYSALTLDDAMAALDRLKGVPFALTVSFDAPHPPFITPYPFYGMYPSGSIPDPTTVEDPKTASPYHHPHHPRSPSGDEAQVRQQTSNYYGMIAQNDKMVGELLSRLDQLNLASRTLVIYVSDHGEMLGDHHMQSKNIFYEGSVHIPLIMRLPGVIPAGKVVSEPVSNMALFGTITDYLGLPGLAPSTSESLRPLIEGTKSNGSVIFSFWDTDVEPAYMALDGRFKLMIGRKETGGGVDALYDLQNDPTEVINLLRSPYVSRPLSQLHPHEKDDIVPLDKARRLQTALVDWLEDTGSQYASAVAKRQMNTGHINQVPLLVTPMPDVTWRVGQPNTLTIPAGTFLDVDGDHLTFSGTLDRGNLPQWLQVHPDDGRVRGTPPSKGRYLLRLTATDHKAGGAFVELQLEAK
ncbi:hypothetical protein EMIHUDRAFT_202442 [Emiliania huxleyi CCMP1516]|uniref:Dystroglycan-type cadherin-like domain-containing protein n=2 Tax=Emiliania huxleyi TaxID=2903 RepID=A0A0D3KBS2_EMIH1|nr:hypothetical protein EMIHUDRAFT_202442 [Emiliania huxleyi CCMP1516]EOD33207.1 hypothetical protein EMIHUDRAFT_202442 [Emiliania huxleyi CCMP1516]|eukprot:XP_005785636.1 hypothetical protein EMIHUDRAFT_202442 [Emiliania huxleyi CCMP1516]